MKKNIFLSLSLLLFFVSCKKLERDNPLEPRNRIVIGNQGWTDKNLDVATYRNGDPIPEVQDVSAWGNLTTGAWCYYNNDPANGAVYGKLYNWYAVNDPRGLAPVGYHIPSDAEWTILTDYLRVLDIRDNNYFPNNKKTGGKMKETGTAHWLAPNIAATNCSGFAGFPGGYRDSNVQQSLGFYAIGERGGWWSATESSSSHAWSRDLYYDYGGVGRDTYDKRIAHSVRCLGD